MWEALALQETPGNTGRWREKESTLETLFLHPGPGPPTPPWCLSLTGGHEFLDDSLSWAFQHTPPIPWDPKSPSGYSPHIPQGNLASLGT